MTKVSLTEILNSSPVIVCGMHRSGTSLISRVLSEIGVFMGQDTEVNNESLSFQLLNDKLLTLTHSYWDQIEGARFFFNDKQAVNQATELIVSNYFTRRFLKGYLGKRTIMDIMPHWGWKDPRNTITLPLWSHVFNKAKIIFIYRNGIDSATSLVAREKKQDFDITIPAYSSRCGNLYGAFGLWKEYNAFFLNYKEKIAPDNLLEIKYEDFLKTPESFLDQLSVFLHKPINQQLKDKIVQETNSSRAYSFMGNNELENFYSTVKDDEVMVKLGYNKI